MKLALAHTFLRSKAFPQLLLFTVILNIFAVAQAHALNEKKNVLFLNSYHNGYHWSDGLLKGVRSVLSESQHKIDLQIEYMDAKKFTYADLSQNLFALYKKKFKDESFDIIVVSDNDALNFVNEHRKDLFPGIPIVFCGINDLKYSDISSDNITGVVEVFDFTATLEVAKKIHPERKRIIVLIDDSTAGTAIRKQIEKISTQNSTGIEVEYWIQLSLPEAQRRVASLPDDTMLFIAPYYQTTSDGDFYTSEEVSEAIYQHSTVPIYTAWEFMVGYGAVGGRVLSGFEQGKTAGRMALQILNETPADDIPIVNEPGGIYLFDYAVMKKLNIIQELLPPNRKIINEPAAIYAISKDLFWTIMVSLFLLLIALISMVIAMLERRKVEVKIKDQLNFQETLMDTIPQLVSWKDTDGRYLGANRAFTDFFGLKDAEHVEGLCANDFIKDHPYVQWSTSVDLAVIESQKSFRKLRRKVVDQNNNEGWLEVNKVPLKGQGDKVLGVLSTAENITKEQNLERQLLQSQKLEAIGTLAGGISHDFNNILTSIINSTELAIGDIDPDTQTAADLRRVLKAAHRGGQVVQQILSFSRPSKEGFHTTDLAEIIQEVVHLMEASTPANIQVIAHIEAGQNFFVHADPTQMHQAILNLATNAYHALKKRGGDLQIELTRIESWRAETEDGQISTKEFIQLTVNDNGPGIPEEIIHKIFDPFFSTKSKAEGTGLGLAVVHGIIQSHQGTIKVESTETKGTTFKILLPAGKPKRTATLLNHQDSTGREGHILFVEDDLDQLQTTPRLLEEMGFLVTAIQDPVEALTLASSGTQHFDILISDFDMPTMSGAELAKSLPDLPVILVSGRADARFAARDCPNIFQVIIKPYHKKDLIQSLNEIWENK
ncbi:MAG: two-component system cell cycle sensor histidine kinase/response regulator CckA [Desulforhopalus sp.]|jgi:two-component system cell cycle sensor histidine kinase/response regulator CckA